MSAPTTTSSLGVAAVAGNDVWAVGYHYGSGPSQTLVEHWNGSTWSVLPSPNVGVAWDELDAVAARAGNDVWAVGHYLPAGSYQWETLVEHWDGTAWSVVPSPNAGTSDNYLTGIAALAGNDVWAVGYYEGDGGYQTLVEHWNGTAWSIVPSPNAGSGSNALTGVVALAGNDVWTVGYFLSFSVSGVQTLVEHWDGTAWSVVPSPNAATGYTQRWGGGRGRQQCLGRGPISHEPCQLSDGRGRLGRQYLVGRAQPERRQRHG